MGCGYVDNGKEPLPTYPQPRRRRIYIGGRLPEKGKLHLNRPHFCVLTKGSTLGKNPSDVWEIVAQDWETGLWDVPNCKANHPEKTIHPAQFPIELVERCVLAFTEPGDWVFD